MDALKTKLEILVDEVTKLEDNIAQTVSKIDSLIDTAVNSVCSICIFFASKQLTNIL